MPKRVERMGVNRTDAGQLGYGIYFGGRSLTSSRYSSVFHSYYFIFIFIICCFMPFFFFTFVYLWSL